MSKSQPVMINGQRVGKLKASWILFKETWKYLKADKEVVWIPLISGFLNLALFGVLVALFVLGGQTDSSMRTEGAPLTAVDYVFIFGYYVICAFSVAIAQAGICHTVYTRAHGGNSTLGQSLKTAFSHWPSLLLWSAISSTVGLLLRLVAEHSRLLGKIVSALLGSAWSVLTYFVVPAMVIDKQTAFVSIHKSAQVFKGTWGETLVSNVSLGAAFLLAHVLVALSLFGLAFVVRDSIALVLILAFVYLVWVIVAALIQSAMESILKTLLYIYASESNYPPNFNSELLSQMLVRSSQASKVSDVPTQVTPLV